jgi:RNA polymerase sigma-70 factor (ECF subfamily)
MPVVYSSLCFEDIRYMSNSRDDIARNAQIVQLLATHHRSLLSYVFSLVPNRADAEDIVHDTIVVILEKFGEFQQGTDFLAWARTIAYNRVGTFIQKKRATASGVFDDQLRASIATEWERIQTSENKRQTALQDCLEKLPDRSRRLLLARYEPGGNAAGAAELLGYSPQAAYKALARLRRKLAECIERKLLSTTT